MHAHRLGKADIVLWRIAPDAFHLEVWRSFADYVTRIFSEAGARARLLINGEKAVKTHVRVLVIGGGVVGVSTLYHLTKKGWTDVALIERTELTAGSTWHAAGLLPLFNMSYTVGQLHKYSVDLYKRLPAETGQDVSFHVTGNLRLATCPDGWTSTRSIAGPPTPSECPSR